MERYKSYPNDELLEAIKTLEYNRDRCEGGTRERIQTRLNVAANEALSRGLIDRWEYEFFVQPL